MGSALFLVDQCVKSLMLGFEFLDHCLIHWCRSFQSESHHRVINHESVLLSWAISRFGETRAPLAVNADLR
jgi:hypothetical protein